MQPITRFTLVRMSAGNWGSFSASLSRRLALSFGPEAPWKSLTTLPKAMSKDVGACTQTTAISTRTEGILTERYEGKLRAGVMH